MDAEHKTKYKTSKATTDAMDKILKGDVKQIPRWNFVVKNIILWTLGLLCILFGALSVSLIIFTLANNALDIRGLAYQHFWQHLIIFVPLLWLVGVLLFVFLFKLFIRHTKRGYKYSLSIILLVNLLLSILLGLVFYFVGISYVIDDVLGSHFRAYHSVEKRQGKIFERPYKGILIGRVADIDNNQFVLITPSNNDWIIISKYIPAKNKQSLVAGNRIVVLGKKISEDTFVACDIRERGMMGVNKQMQARHVEMMKKMNCDETTCGRHRNMHKLPQDIDRIIEDACSHIQN